jgi:hypothetical protein
MVLTNAAMLPPAQAQTISISKLYITATVINSCSFDSTATELMSITCSMQTPVVAAATGTTAGTGGTPVPLSLKNTTTTLPLLATTKFCNFLGTSKLENASFNEFTLDIARHTAGSAAYYSTMQVCF